MRITVETINKFKWYNLDLQQYVADMFEDEIVHVLPLVVHDMFYTIYLDYKNWDLLLSILEVSITADFEIDHDIYDEFLSLSGTVLKVDNNLITMQMFMDIANRIREVLKWGTNDLHEMVYLGVSPDMDIVYFGRRLTMPKVRN